MSSVPAWPASHPPAKREFAAADEPALHIITHRSQFTLGFTLGGVHFMGLDKYMVTFVHHTILSIFFCLNKYESVYVLMG